MHPRLPPWRIWCSYLEGEPVRREALSAQRTKPKSETPKPKTRCLLFIQHESRVCAVVVLCGFYGSLALFCWFFDSLFDWLLFHVLYQQIGVLEYHGAFHWFIHVTVLQVIPVMHQFRVSLSARWSCCFWRVHRDPWCQHNLACLAKQLFWQIATAFLATIGKTGPKGLTSNGHSPETQHKIGHKRLNISKLPKSRKESHVHYISTLYNSAESI